MKVQEKLHHPGCSGTLKSLTFFVAQQDQQQTCNGGLTKSCMAEIAGEGCEQSQDRLHAQAGGIAHQSQFLHWFCHVDWQKLCPGFVPNQNSY